MSTSLPYEKECSMCAEVKPINTGRSFRDGFYKRAGTADGYRNQCKSCYKAQRYETQQIKLGNSPFAGRDHDSVGVSPDLVPDLTDNKIIRHSKFCKSCGQTKPYEAFHKHKRAKFGIHPECKDCRLEKAFQKRTKSAGEEYDTYDPTLMFD